MSNKNKCILIKPLVYEYYIVPNIETNSTGNYFTPDEGPSWLDYLEFFVSDDYSFMKVDNNNETFTCREGYIIVWDPLSKSIEQICKNKEEFEDIFVIKRY